MREHVLTVGRSRTLVLIVSLFAVASMRPGRTEEEISSPARRLISYGEMSQVLAAARTNDALDPKLSPSGRYVYFRTAEGIRILDVETDLKIQPVIPESLGVGPCYWGETAGKDRLLCFHLFGEDKRLRIASIDPADPSAVRDLTPEGGVVAPAGAIPGDRRRILILAGDRKDLYRLDIETGDAELVFENTPGFVGFHADNAGRIRLAVSSNRSLYHRATEKDLFEKIVWDSPKNLTPLRYNQLYAFTPDNRKIYVATDRWTDRIALTEVDPGTGKGNVLFEHPLYDLYPPAARYVRCPVTGRIMGATVQLATECAFFLDDGFRAVHAAIQKELPRSRIEYLGVGSDAATFLLAARTGAGVTHHLYDVRRRALKRLPIGVPMPLDPARCAFAHVERVTFKAADGFLLHGQLALPPGRRPGERVPAVIEAHPEPWRESATQEDRPIFQLFPSRGYAVLRLDHRGCYSLGRTYQRGAFGEFTGKMLTDFQDAARWLTGQGIADPDRIGIMGAYWGGFAAVHNAAFHPDLFACAVSVNGSVDPIRLARTLPAFYRMFDGLSREESNDITGRDEELKKVSPFHKEKREIRRPIFLVNTRADPFTSLEENTRFVEELRLAGGEASHLVMDGIANVLFAPEELIRRFAEIEAFFARHLGGEQTPSPAE